MTIRFTRRTIPAVTALFALCAAPALHAATNTGAMLVSATIQNTCVVSASPLAFGTVIAGVSADTTAVVSATCTAGTVYTLDLGDGVNATVAGGTGFASGVFRRQMASGTYRLPYALYQEVARSTEIAAAAVAAYNNFLTTTVGSGVAQTRSVFGRVIGAESIDKLPGVYSDTVVVTIAF